MESKKQEDKTVKIAVLDFFGINLLSLLIPAFPCLIIFLMIEFLIFQALETPLLLHLLAIPIIGLLLYYFYLLLLIEFGALWVKWWNKKSPPKQGIFARILDTDFPEGRMLEYYHKRGFIIKMPVWLTSKSPFPWLVNRALRRITHNKIGENVVYCDSYVGLEFTEIGPNTFLYPTAALSSHAVNSIFGKISILEIKLGHSNVIYPGVIAGPGVHTEDNFVIYPNTVLHKNWRGKKEKKYYQGSPGRAVEPPRFAWRN
ncbi:MAG: hypothetical protein ACOC44_14965 [Promethearchaeia archaeon]